jgi:tRNA threonylcarbamoyladenosine biosynthesis protein TsaB
MKMSVKSSKDKYYLYLDTSEPEAELIVFQGNNFLIQRKWMAHRELSKTLSGEYQKIMKKARIERKDLSGICVFSGPGSFTGLRIGISFANALAFGLDIPVYETKKKGILNTRNPKKIVIPFYGSEPRITKPKKK